MVERERPEKVVCLLCGKELDLLHHAHLKTHGFTSQEEYRQAYGLESEALSSESFSDKVSEASREPDRLAKSSNMGLSWGQERRRVAAELGGQGLFTPGEASRVTGIHEQTIYSAIQEGRLLSSMACLLSISNKGVKRISSKPAYLIETSDLENFVQDHKPKHSGRSSST